MFLDSWTYLEILTSTWQMQLILNESTDSNLNVTNATDIT